MNTITKLTIPALFLSLFLLGGCSARPDAQAKQADNASDTLAKTEQSDNASDTLTKTEQSDNVSNTPVQTVEMKEETDMPYIFTAQSSMENMPASSKVCNIIEDLTNYETDNALVYGKLKTLFGEPIYETEDNENLYSYCILATSEDGASVYLNVYSGPTGPAIGGAHDAETQKAAQALVDYIWLAEPSDYECTSYYMDVPCRIQMGVRDGIPYCEAAELSPEELEALSKRIWGLDE